MATDKIQCRIFGAGLTPENVSLHELADLLKGFEQAVLSTAEQSEQAAPEEAPMISLTGVEDGSLRLQFAAVSFAVMLAFSEVAQALETDTYNALPKKALEGVQKLVSFSQKRQCDFEFYRPNIQSAPVARISHAHPPDLFARRTFVGNTDLYGEVNRLGGAEPKIQMRLSSGALFPCECSKDFARSIADKLYKVVGLHGTAFWDTQTLQMKRFIATDLLPYEEVPLTEAFAELRRVTQGYAPVDDVEKYVQELRGI